MAGLVEVFATHPFWAWLALGAVLLIAETLTGSGWMLWPAVSAGVTAVVVLTGLLPAVPAQVGLFAVLTLIATVLAKPWLSKPGKADLNDRALRVLGQTGEARGEFVGGRGRVFVDGAEWPAELDGGGELAAGARVTVVKVEGARLVVGRA
jgi:membrane protein implicated in regulation of membrane protease activity